jgi:aminomethyltransferase
MVEFGGFEMPLQYSSIAREHAAVRERAGLFDVSHMGQIHVTGPHAVASVERLLSCPIESLRIGRVRYGLLCNAEGGVVDDVTVYRLAEDELMLCVNASNIDKDDAWVREHGGAAEIDNRSAATGLLALQGPLSEPLLEALSDGASKNLKRFGCARLQVAGCAALVSRTGYTGSAGFEIYLDAADTSRVFDALLERGGPDGLEPAGLGARDTLRLEAALPLYGHELNDERSPLDAGLARFMKREAGGFIGAEAIERRAAAGQTHRLVGFVLEERGVARADYPIAAAGETVGVVTSGAPSFSLGKSIGLGYVAPAHAEVGSRIDIVIRNRAIAARVVETPFVRAPKKQG